MTRFVFILVAVMAVGGMVCAQEAPNDPPKKDEQKEPALSPELAAQIEKLIMQLGDDDFEKREVAQAELIKIGVPALAPVEKALKETEDPEVRMRATAIAEQIAKLMLTFIGKNDQGHEEYRHEKTGMVFVKITAGTFKMGSNEYYDEKPAHDVKVGDFFIAKYEVTQTVWRKIMGDDPSHEKRNDNPVEQVSWEDCQEFCQKTGLRLPTEAEWEYACRAGSTTKYYWGDNPDEAYIWYNANSEYRTHPVGEKKPNGFGLFDMSGNAWEWCSDWYAKDYYKSSPYDNPTGPDSGKYRVVRGGTLGYEADICRSSRRDSIIPTSRKIITGFRCAVSVK